eukprot:m.241907 g.241907  ORF g.241907 m.241907 type:complete len:241 (-) comp17448_c0_seq11:2608-3330(-)
MLRHYATQLPRISASKRCLFPSLTKAHSCRWLSSSRNEGATSTASTNTDMPHPRVAIVTGAASGIGLACVDKFISRGYYVALWDVSESAIAAIPSHPQLETAVVDVAEFEQVEEAANRLKLRHGHIEVLINNAAIQPDQARCPLHEVPSFWWNRVFQVNVGGMYNTARAVIPTMIAQHKARKELQLPHTGGGVILNMSSVQGLMSQPGRVCCCMVWVGFMQTRSPIEWAETWWTCPLLYL